MRFALWTLLTVWFVLMVTLFFQSSAHAASIPWKTTLATWYGPDYYGNTTACGQHYTIRTRGIAHPTMKCGSKLTIRRNGRVVRVKVIDSCRCVFDLSARTAMDLCACQAPYTMRVQWRHGWLYGQALRP